MVESDGILISSGKGARVSWLSHRIRGLVFDGRYIIGEHASERLVERSIMEWQIVAAMVEAQEIDEHPSASPHPTAEFLTLLPDGVEVKAVWSYLRTSDAAKLVTVHYFDRD
jgi:hypothetical protein